MTMIASDYIRCAPDEQEHVRRYEAVREDIACIIQTHMGEFVSTARVNLVAEQVMQRLLLSCYYPNLEGR